MPAVTRSTTWAGTPTRLKAAENRMLVSFAGPTRGRYLGVDAAHGEFPRGSFRGVGAELLKGAAEFPPRLVGDIAPVELADELAHGAVFFSCRPRHVPELVRGQGNRECLGGSHGSCLVLIVFSV